MTGSSCSFDGIRCVLLVRGRGRLGVLGGWRRPGRGYVLAAFVVVPVRWLRDYGWRHLTEVELRASVAYYQRLGTLMAALHSRRRHH